MKSQDDNMNHHNCNLDPSATNNNSSVGPPTTKKVKFCEQCNIEVSKSNWARHIKTKHTEGYKNILHCTWCNNDVSKSNWARHAKSKHSGNSRVHCDVCNIEITKTNWARHVKSQKHNRTTTPPATSKQNEYKQEFKDQTYRKLNFTFSTNNFM